MTPLELGCQLTTPHPCCLPWEAPPAVPGARRPVQHLSPSSQVMLPTPLCGLIEEMYWEREEAENFRNSPDGIPKAETTCFWRLGCPTSLVMMGELTTSNCLGEKGTDFGVRQMQALGDKAPLGLSFPICKMGITTPASREMQASSSHQTLALPTASPLRAYWDPEPGLASSQRADLGNPSPPASSSLSSGLLLFQRISSK